MAVSKIARMEAAARSNAPGDARYLQSLCVPIDAALTRLSDWTAIVRIAEARRELDLVMWQRGTR